MEHDTLNDDLVETQIFDLGTLELNKTCQKTFTFREVLQRHCKHCLSIVNCCYLDS